MPHNLKSLVSIKKLTAKSKKTGTSLPQNFATQGPPEQM